MLRSVGCRPGLLSRSGNHMWSLLSWRAWSHSQESTTDDSLRVGSDWLGQSGDRKGTQQTHTYLLTVLSVHPGQWCILRLTLLDWLTTGEDVRCDEAGVLLWRWLTVRVWGRLRGTGQARLGRQLTQSNTVRRSSEVSSEWRVIVENYSLCKAKRPDRLPDYPPAHTKLRPYKFQSNIFRPTCFVKVLKHDANFIFLRSWQAQVSKTNNYLIW